MNSAVFVVLVSFVVLAAGVDNNIPSTKVFSSFKLTTRDEQSDIAIIES